VRPGSDRIARPTADVAPLAPAAGILPGRSSCADAPVPPAQDPGRAPARGCAGAPSEDPVRTRTGRVGICGLPGEGQEPGALASEDGASAQSDRLLDGREPGPGMTDGPSGVVPCSMEPNTAEPSSPRLHPAGTVGTSNFVSETSPLETDPQPDREFFSRARTPPPKRRWTVLWAVLIGVGLFLAVKAVFAPYVGVRAATPWGLITVKPDMPRTDVDRAFGSPLARVSSGEDGECLLYGQPAVRSEPFSIYRICYRDGRVSEVSERQYEGYGVAPDGEIVIPQPEGP